MRTFLLTILLSFLLVMAAGTVAAESRTIVQWSDIPQAAMTEDGLANIIVEVHVPGYEQLAEASAAITPPAPDEPNADSVRTAMAEADAELTAAIQAVTSQVLALLPGTSYRNSHHYQYVPMLAMQAAPDALWALQMDPNVKAIYADIPSPLPNYGPSDPPDHIAPSQDDSSGLSTPVLPSMTDTIGLIAADKAWDRGYTGSGWHVAIIDSGIRRTHELFQGKTITEACFTAVDRHCPNGQGAMIGTGAAAHHPSRYRGWDHGTHVAGTAAGKMADGSLYGVARDADIIAVNVFFREEYCPPPVDGPCVLARGRDVLRGLEYVYGLRGSHNIGAVNMSLGGGRYGSYCDDDARKPIIDQLIAAHIPTAIATGNAALCGEISAPACISTAIAVLASTKADRDTTFSNWHPVMADIFAPGQDIRSATGISDTSFASWSGTSMATPHVSGALTLMRHAQPTITPADSLARLTERGPSVGTRCPGGGSKHRVYVDNFPDTSPWKTEVGIVNVASSSFAGTLRGFDSGGSQVFVENVTGGPHERWSWDVAQLAGATASQIKSMRLDINDGLAVGYQKFYQEGKYRVGLEAQPRSNSTGLFLPHIDSSANWWTGIGLINTTDSQKNMQIIYDNGHQDSLTLGPGAHAAPVITQGGSARVTEGSGTVGLLLFGTANERQLSGVTLSDNASRLLVYPHIANDDQWWTGYVVYNPNDSPAEITGRAYDSTGAVTAESTITLQAYSKHVGVPDFPGDWFTIESTEPTLPLLGFELFGTKNENQLAGFSVVDLATKEGVFPNLETSGWTGIAFVNATSLSNAVQLEARENNGTLVAAEYLSLGSGQKIVRPAEDLFPEQDITSATYIRFTSTEPIVGFQLNGSADGTMLDAIPALGSPANLGTNTLYFPHIDAQ